MTTKGKKIAYWTTTGLIAFFIGSGGVAQVAQYLGNPHGVVPILRYPMYFFGILGIWKALGAIASAVYSLPIDKPSLDALLNGKMRIDQGQSPGLAGR